MVALVIDVGYVYSEKARLQTLADASALAGASQLPDNAKATQKSREVALLNGLQITDLLNATQDATNPRILRVSVQRDVPTFFSKLFGINTFTVTASAGARNPGDTWPRPPMGIINRTFEANTVYVFTYASKNYYVLPSGYVTIGETITVSTGAISSTFFPPLPVTLVTPLITLAPNDKKLATVQRFALFEVTKVHGNDITAKFVRYVLEAELGKPVELIE